MTELTTSHWILLHELTELDTFQLLPSHTKVTRKRKDKYCAIVCLINKRGIDLLNYTLFTIIVYQSCITCKK